MSHLEIARRFLSVAESHDAKREAYKSAAEEIAAHIKETGDTQTQVSVAIDKHRDYVSRLLKWRKAGYPEGTTPFTMADSDGSKPTDRAARSHTKRVLREEPEVITEMVEELHDDPAFSAAVMGAASKITSKTEKRREDRDRVERGLSEQDAKFERLRREAQNGNHGHVEDILRGGLEVDDEVRAFLHKQADRLRALAEWYESWADSGRAVDDAALQAWLEEA